MSFQGHDGLNARTEELHRHILRSHLAYLNQEETPTKLQLRHNLECLISEFLSCVPHSAKFTFFEVAKILNESIDGNVGFSAYKAGTAFEALEKYATNLITHPWRKEYKTVKLYSGFYKHSVENQLLGGGAFFHLLGYQFTDDGVMFLDEPIDPDKVARVALDCLVAYVECQIMLQICERIKSYKCSWFDISQVRQDYACGIDEAVRILHQLKRNELETEKQDRWLRDQENGALMDDKVYHKNESGSAYPKTGILVDVSNTWPNSSGYAGYSHNNSSILQSSYTKSHKTPQHSKLPSWSEEDGYPTQSHNFLSSKSSGDYTNPGLDMHLRSSYDLLNKSIGSDARYGSSDLTLENYKDSWDILQPTLYRERHDPSSFVVCDSHPTDFSNSTVPNVKDTPHFNHLFSPQPAVPLGIPTYTIPHNFALSATEQCPCQMCHEHQLSTLPQKYQYPKDSSPYELEPMRRLGGRTEQYEANASELCSSLLKMSLDTNPTLSTKSRHFPPNPSFTTYPTTHSNPSNDSVIRSGLGSKSQQQNRGSYYDNVTPSLDVSSETNGSFGLSGQSLTPKCDFQTNGTLLGSSTSAFTAKPKKGLSVTDSVGGTPPSKPVVKKSYSSGAPGSPAVQGGVTLTSESEKTSLKDSKSGKKWSCASCTFYNSAEKSICDMCGRSKHPGPEVTPLVSGGRECPQCTLVNKKDCEDCTACGASLKDSPTYI